VVKDGLMGGGVSQPRVDPGLSKGDSLPDGD